uniref:Apolipoprotein A-IV a n=1 Tax=Monopterus albus TaxID=43700 RepID=A0A3Q3JIG9_MONAL
MKVFVVLAITLLSGCHANLFYADASKAQLEVLTDAFWDYVAKATQTADDTLQMIKKSQFGQEVNARLAESADIASRYTVGLQEQLSPTAQDLMTKLTTEADLLKKVLAKELESVRDKLEPYTEDTKAQIQHRVEQLKQELAPYADSLDSETLRTTLMQKSEELKAVVEQSVMNLQHLQNLQDSVAPMTKKVQVELSQRANLLKQMVAPYAEDLREKLDPYAQDLQAQLMTLYQSLTNAN